jgi:prepilin-type N-terminal cleavage/methylation domain-containing protein
MIVRRDGFSLVEVIMAMLILTVGILAMGTSIGYVLSQLRAAELRTERSVAVRDVAERLRATPWADVPAACEAPFEAARYTITCSTELAAGSADVMRVRLISVGPGYVSGGVRPDVADTTAMSLAAPYPE